MAKSSPAPQIPGLSAGPVLESTWCDDKAKAWAYYAPSDCRPISKRISVFLRADGVDSTVQVIEGDGRKADFKVHASRTLPKGASEDVAVTVASKMAHLLRAPSPAASTGDERLVAGILTDAGFHLDDFWGGEAWVKPSPVEGFTIYVRGEPDPQFVSVKGEEITVPLSAALSCEMPVEVGIASDFDDGRSMCVAPCLEEGLRVIMEGKLPLPSEDEVFAFDFDRLFNISPAVTRGPR